MTRGVHCRVGGGGEIRGNLSSIQQPPRHHLPSRTCDDHYFPSTIDGESIGFSRLWLDKFENVGVISSFTLNPFITSSLSVSFALSQIPPPLVFVSLFFYLPALFCAIILIASLSLRSSSFHFFYSWDNVIPEKYNNISSQLIVNFIWLAWIINKKDYNKNKNIEHIERKKKLGTTRIEFPSFLEPLQVQI